MKLGSLISFVFLAGSVAAAQYTKPQPQNFGTAGMESLGLTFSPITHSCPVSLHAQHGLFSGNTVKVDKSRPAGLAQLLHLVLTSPDSRQIVRGSLTVRGLSGKARMTQTEGSPNQGDVVRNLEVRFTPQEGRNAAGDVWAPGMSAVLTVELHSVTFADGSVWRFAGHDGCRVEPDGLMLIAGK